MPIDGEQGLRLYEWLSKRKPDEGFTLDDMCAVTETTPGRTTQLLNQIRTGKLPIPHQRRGERFSALNVNFDRKANLYFNMGNAQRSQSPQARPDVIRSWMEDLGTRAGSVARVFSAQLNAAENMDRDSALAFLDRVPGEEIDAVVTAINEIQESYSRAVKMRRRLARAH